MLAAWGANRRISKSVFVREQWICMQLCLDTGNKQSESLWITGLTNVGDIIMGVCYRECLLRRKKEMKCSSNNWKKTHIQRC